jgi:hypothetical protein
MPYHTMQSILRTLHLMTVTAAIVGIAFHTVPYYAVNIMRTTSHDSEQPCLTILCNQYYVHYNLMKISCCCLFPNCLVQGKVMSF